MSVTERVHCVNYYEKTPFVMGELTFGIRAKKHCQHQAMVLPLEAIFFVKSRKVVTQDISLVVLSRRRNYSFTIGPQIA